MEGTERKKIFKKILQVVFPLLLGAFILFWVYRDFNFQRVGEVLTDGMDYRWMALSLVFGVFANLFRGWRWKLALEPLGEYPKTSHCVYAIFISYASNLVIPRVGEVTRCGVLSKYDGVSFSQSLGTVVSERMIDTLCVGLITGLVLLLQMPVFATFFAETGTNVGRYAQVLTSGHFYLIILCALAILVLAFFLIRNIALFAKLKGILQNIWQGVIALKDIRQIPLYIMYTLGIWVCYFLEFYLAFYAFGFSAHLGITAGLVMFVVGTLAVIVPTPNGAGPWHFAVMTMMMLYGVGKEDAGIFALLVHGIQTFLLILLGIYGLSALPFTNKLK
ncbi:MAG: flippase-like domain-containing protein [Bacteroides sp.]|nr:flippase-like domain-containing protein [Bacteroides sp.]MBQ8874268.1 flippase-like domain-containing protein [Bacteroides sp.]